MSDLATMKRMQGRGESFRNVDIFRELLSGTLVEGNNNSDDKIFSNVKTKRL